MSRRDDAHALQGTRAGFVSRVVAATVDVLVVFSLLVGLLAIVAAVRFLFSDEPYEFPDLSVVANSTFLLVLLVALLSITWSGSGRTLGNQVVGLRVVRDDGGDVSWPRAFARALIVVLLPVLALGWILVSKKNAGLHDLATRTTVIYDWRPRQRRPPAARSDSRQAR